MNWTIPTIFEIVSIGDAELLAQAFNGLAAITNSGNFVDMTRAAFLVGLLAFGARAFMTGRFELTTLLASLMIYALMFGPRATVIVVDHYSGAARAIANVPVGIAAPFSLVSMTGRYFAETFESAFAVIGPDNQYLGAGYLDALTVLLRMRDIQAGTANSPETDRSSDITKSVKNYLVGCVYYDLELRDTGSPSQVTREKIRNAANLWGALRTTFVNISVMLYLPGDGDRGRPYNCKNAYEALTTYLTPGSAWMRDHFNPWLKSQLDKNLRSDITADVRIQGALNSINLASVDAATYSINSYLVTVLRTADQSFYTSRNDVASAIISSQAENQRNVQWVAERTMFEKVARPVTAFIEVFLVAATPLMAFAIAAFGTAGVSTLGKYLLLHFWVTLWAPTLAIANMFTYTRVVRMIDHVRNSTTGMPLEPASLLGMDAILPQLQTEFATGSMLAASTPMLTLLLIYGSSQVASMLASKMSSAEQVDAKIASPPVLQPGPIVRHDSMHSGNPLMGLHKTGAGLPTVNFAQSALDTKVAADSAVLSSSNGLSTSLGRTYRDSQGSGFDVRYTQGVGWTNSGGQRTGESAVVALAQDAGQGTNMSVGAKAALQRAVTDAFAYGGGLSADLAKIAKGKVPVNGEVGIRVVDTLSRSAGVDPSEARSFLASMKMSASKNNEVGRDFNQLVSEDGKFASGRSYTKSASKDDSEQLSRDWNKSAQAQRSYQEAQTLTGLANFNDSMNPLQLLDRYRARGGTNGAADHAYGGAFGGDTKLQRSKLDQMMSALSSTMTSAPYEDRKTAAMLMVMASPENKSAHLIGQAISTAAPDKPFNIDRNNDVRDEGQRVQQQSASLLGSPRVAAALAAAGDSTAAAPGAVASGEQQAKSDDAAARATGGARRQYENGAPAVAQHHNAGAAAVNVQAINNDEAYRDTVGQATGTPLPQTAFGPQQSFPSSDGRRLEPGSSGMRNPAAYSAFSDAKTMNVWDQTMRPDYYKNMPPLLRKLREWSGGGTGVLQPTQK